jgi:RND family efflux transporter MFP subunit
MKNLKIKPIALMLIAALGLAAVGYLVFAPSSKAKLEKKTEAPKPALTVTSATPQSAQLPISLSANGNVAAWQEANIGSESNGLRLQEVRVNVGDAVRAGEVLAVFAADTVKADLAQAQATVTEARANAAEANANAARARTLEATGALSEQQINQYMTAAQTAEARIASAKANLDVQQLRLKQTQVVAPDAGVISARSASVGSVLGAGSELFRMIRQARLEWRAEVTASELGRLQAGTIALVTASNGSVLKGSVRMVGPTVDPQTRSALVYVDLPQIDPKKIPPQAPFKAGMYASGRFELGSSQAMTVAQQSVVVRDGFSYVFRLNADQRVSQVKVQLGRRIGNRVEVLDGISSDTRIVLAGAGFLNEGDLVRVVATVTSPVAAVATPVAATLATPAVASAPASAAAR